MDEYHRDALERTIVGGADVLADDQHAALVALCRSLADQMDDAEPNGGPSTRLVAAYLSALKDVWRVLAEKRAGVEPSGTLAVLRAGLPGKGRTSGRRPA